MATTTWLPWIVDALKELFVRRMCSSDGLLNLTQAQPLAQVSAMKRPKKPLNNLKTQVGPQYVLKASNITAFCAVKQYPGRSS